VLAVAGLVGTSTAKCRLAGAQQRPADGHELGTMSSAAVGRPGLAGQPPHPTTCFPNGARVEAPGNPRDGGQNNRQGLAIRDTNKIAGNKIAGRASG